MRQYQSVNSVVRHSRGAAVFGAAALLAGAAGGVMSVAADASIITGATVVNNGNGSASVDILPAGFDIVITGKNFTAVGPIDIVFTVGGSGSETYTVAEGITNNTPTTWTDYEEELGSDSGDNFVISSSPPNFAAPDLNTGFADTQLQDDTIDMSQGSVARNGTLAVGFELTVPDLTSGSTFTLRQFPTIPGVLPPAVPEPVSRGLLGLGLLGLLARRRHIHVRSGF